MLLQDFMTKKYLKMLPINVKEMPFQQNSPISTTFQSPHGGVTVTPWWPLSDSNEGSDKPQTKWLELAPAVQCSPFWPQSSIVDFDTLVGCKKWPWFSPSLKRCWVKKNLFYGVKTTWIYGPLSLSNHDLSLSTGLIYSNVLRPSVHNGSISTGG